MRILFLSTYFQPDIASTGVLMTQLAEELAREGHQVTVLTSMPHYDTNQIWKEFRGKLVEHEKRDDMDIYRLYLYVPTKKHSFFGRMLNYASFNLLAVIVGVVLGRHDLIFVPSPPLTNGLAADIISRILGMPFVYNVQDIWPDVVIRAGVMNGKRVIKISRWMEEYVYKRARFLTVISDGFKRNLISKGVPSHKIVTIPNFFDTDFVRPLPRSNGFSKEYGLDDKFVVLFAGNVGHSQGLETVLEAAKMLMGMKEILFLIVGNGVAKSILEVYAQELDLDNVRFLPFQPHKVLPEMYSSADVCLVPLRKGFTNESVPCKVFTIMASKKPMIASLDEESETHRLIQEAECGIWVPPEDPGALSEAIRTVFIDSKFQILMGTNGRNHVVDNYTRQIIGQKYSKILSEIVTSS